MKARKRTLRRLSNKQLAARKRRLKKESVRRLEDLRQAIKPGSFNRRTALKKLDSCEKAEGVLGGVLMAEEVRNMRREKAK